MRRTSLSSVAVLMIVAALIWSGRVGGAPTKSEEARLKIVPVVMIKPGEKTQLLMSTACTLGATRGGGLNVREMDPKGSSPAQNQDQRVWNRGGLTIEVPDFQEGPKQAASEKFAAFKGSGVSVFAIKINADSNTKPGLYNMHLVDATCSGHCQTDFRVLVVEE